jgi:hypothetical protein
MIEFVKFPKIPRLSRECIITEKIDGTNACVFIEQLEGYSNEADGSVYCADGLAVWAGSRSRWITPEQDNFGFARWVKEHAEELIALGPGTHHGEWWGQGIQRGYGLKEKRFSLFNVKKWEDGRPACCSVVPVLHRGTFDTERVEGCLDYLRNNGSLAVPGWMKPEGVVIFHVAGNLMFKKTIEKDEEPKGYREVA